ncbi:MAG: ribosomal protein S18-alanine N-acetyltransferase [Chloroflexi bacterium]|nr:ribosomal protein S18-alanine N-acetyltransferase [Chloroflexota bacterium]
MANGHLMGCVLRPMREEDIPQVAAIDRDAFPETWPPPAFRQELRNRLARYLVVADTNRTYREWAQESGIPSDGANPPPGRIVAAVRRLLGGGEQSKPPETEELLTGYLGMWLMVDEAHVTSVGVRSALRGQGIGELLILGAVELSIQLGCHQVTLECRVSNTVAQNLYSKYSFRVVGRRKAYYVDNNEDAYVMTTEPIDTPDYRVLLSELRARHSERWGVSARYLP